MILLIYMDFGLKYLIPKTVTMYLIINQKNA